MYVHIYIKTIIQLTPLILYPNFQSITFAELFLAQSFLIFIGTVKLQLKSCLGRNLI